MFIDIISKYESFDFEDFLAKISKEDIKNIINKSGDRNLDPREFLALLSPKGKELLEEMAIKANSITNQYFGKEIHLYAPLYISNICDNECTYCGFKKSNQIKRRHLTFQEIEQEAKYISENLKVHSVVLLTGESHVNSMEYLEESVRILKKYFSTVIIEIQPLEVQGYEQLEKIGLDGLTIYQECYSQKLYNKYHLQGQKSDYLYRLNSPERGAMANLRAINIGTLFGLGPSIKEAFFAGLHCDYLMRKYLNTSFSISLPRIREAYNNIKPENIVNDFDFVQYLLAYRLAFPTLGINISTRETKEFRDNLLPLGVTKFSAGSITEVGGYSLSKQEVPQFEISDHRSVEDIISMLKDKGYQPILKDWELNIWK